MGSYRLRSLNRPSSGLCTHPRERPEGIVCQDVDSLDSIMVSNCPAPRTREHCAICPGRGEAKQHTLWFVLRLSICLRKTSIQRSLQRNLITSSVSLKRGRSLEKLQHGGK